ncbi:MAG: TolC family protein [Candidatus Poribacteria bacterium]|nr:TolC family protein [Candidatus Poribacteria bacterium]MDE0324941.1 TolC family protein [Candidatus Poribacteria bacterium]
MIHKLSNKDKCPFHYRKCPVTLYISLIIFTVLVGGCASRRLETYQELRNTEVQQPVYYYTEVEKKITNTESNLIVEPDPYLNEIEAKVLKYQKQWQAQLESETPMPNLFYDLSTDTMKAYRELAASPEEARAQLAEPIGLELLVALGYEWSPGLKAAREKIRAVLEQYPQAVYLENVLRQYNAFTKQLNTKVGPMTHKEMMAMKFPFPGTLALKGQVITEDVLIAQKEFEITLRDLVTEIKLAYYDYLFVTEATRINEENQKLLQQMIAIAQAKFRVGQGKYSNVIMAQVELSKLANVIITLEQQRETIIARLNTLLNISADFPLGIPVPVEEERVISTLAELYELAVRKRQEIQKQKLAISKMALVVEMAKQMTYPDPTLGASYLENRSMPDLTHTKKMPMTFMTQRTLNPRNTAWFEHRNSYIHEMDVKIEAMEHKIEELESNLRFVVKKHHFGMETANRSIRLYRQTLLPQAQQALDAANTAYQAAQIDFLSFLDAQRTLLNLRIEEQRALRDYHQHLTQLEQAVGMILPKQPLTQE